MNYRASLCSCNMSSFFRIMDSKPRPLVYLAGPMQYTPDNGETWRKKAERLLKELDIWCLSPLEYEAETIGKDKVLSIQDYCKRSDQEYPSQDLIVSMHQLMAADLYAVENSDYVLVQYSGEKISGTAHECGIAWQFGKKCILVNKCENVHDVPLWFFACFTKVFSELEDAVKYIASKSK